MNKSLLPLLRCSTCNSDTLRLEVFEEDCLGSVINGRCVCSKCEGWFRIQDYLLDMLPVELRDNARYMAFAKKYNLDPGVAAKGNVKNFEVQHVQINFFKKDSQVYDQDVANSRFYVVSDRLCMHKWIKKLPSKLFVLDIGGGTGRQAIPLAGAGHTVVSIDISEEMLRIAQKKSRTEGSFDNIHFILADATSFPFCDEKFDAAISYGTLHHLPHPEQTIKHAGRVLKKGGLWYSYDPNKSPVRFIFELAMKIHKLYQEEPSGNDMLKGCTIRKWCESAGIKANISFSTYILPHWVNILPEKTAYNMLMFTDVIFKNIPFLREFGGLVISEGVKKGN